MSTGEYLTRLHMARESISQAIQDLSRVDGLESVKVELIECADVIAAEMNELMSLEEA